MADDDNEVSNVEEAAIAVAMATTAAAQAAVATAQAAVEVIRLSHPSSSSLFSTHQHNNAAILIQTTFRGYLVINITFRRRNPFAIYCILIHTYIHFN